jgi:hypothetical protein
MSAAKVTLLYYDFRNSWGAIWTAFREIDPWHKVQMAAIPANLLKYVDELSQAFIVGIDLYRVCVAQLDDFEANHWIALLSAGPELRNKACSIMAD